MPHRHPRVTAALATVAVAAGVSLAPAAPTFADPDVEDVQKRVDRLYREAEQAQERSHEAELRLEELTQALTSLKADERRQRQDVQTAQDRVEDVIVRQYQGSTISTVGRLVVADDPQAFLNRLSRMSSYREMQAEQFESYDTQLDALTLRREATAERRQQVKTLQQQREQQQERVQEKLTQAKDLLAELEAEERARLREQREQERREQEAQAREMAQQTTAPAEDAPSPEASESASPEESESASPQESESSSSGGAAAQGAPASGNAGAAVQHALAQVGDAYSYGATGPNAFDCSGLTMSAWAAAGVSLPHSSRAQMGAGPSVSAGNLKPGDLVFYYSPVSHVGIYIGNGKIVHAANPSTDVAITGVHTMPFSGAVRPG